MYLPKHFSEHRDHNVRKLIEENAFATMLSFPENEQPFINHLPLVYSSTPGEESVIIGHMSRQNPQWRHFLNNPNCTLIFNGGHTYITPRWYRSGRDVPTWNYAVVHLHGEMELIESCKDQIEILRQLSVYFEKENSQPWVFELPSDLKDDSSLTNAIVSFKFRTKSVEAKFKLSQNRSAEDKEGIIAGLLERSDDMSRTVRKMMLGLKRF